MEEDDVVSMDSRSRTVTSRKRLAWPCDHSRLRAETRAMASIHKDARGHAWTHATTQGLYWSREKSGILLVTPGLTWMR